MSGSPSRRGQAGKDAEVRRLLIRLIRARKRFARFTHRRPTDVRYWEVVSPESGFPLTGSGMWSEVLRLLEAGLPLKRIALNQPPGEHAWVLRARLSPEAPRLYIKLQIIGSRVLLRSFHLDEYDDD